MTNSKQSGYAIYTFAKHHCEFCQCERNWKFSCSTSNSGKDGLIWIEKQRNFYRKYGVPTALVRLG